MARTPAPGHRMLDIIGVGDSDVDVMIKVDHIPGHDEKVRGTLLGKFPGGIIGNFCSAAAKFGALTGIATVVGDDEYGRLCREDYLARGLDMRGVVVRGDAATYFCIVHLDDSGEKALTLIETPLLVPRPEDVDLEYIRGCRYLHLTSLDFELLRFITLRVAGSVSVSFDIEAHTDQSSLAKWEEVIPKARTVFINEAGLKALMGSEDLAGSARRIVGMGPDAVIVTRGARGSMVFTAGQQFVQPAFAVPVKDTTGAGDCFNAVFLSCLAAGQALEQACLRGTAAAALAIQSVGSRTSFPSRAQVESFLSSHAPGEPETGRGNVRA
jgi:sugar/nucleoside kinase (ribokinase family)